MRISDWSSDVCSSDLPGGSGAVTVVRSMYRWKFSTPLMETIDAGLELATQIGNRSVERINVVTYQAALDVCDRSAPQSEYEAKFSLQHTAAAAITDGKVDFASFDPQGRARHAGLAARTTIAAAEPFAGRYPRAWGAKVTATHGDGSELRDR